MEPLQLQEARMFILAKFFMLNIRKWTATATISISVSVFLVSLIGMGRSNRQVPRKPSDSWRKDHDHDVLDHTSPHQQDE